MGILLSLSVVELAQKLQNNENIYLIDIRTRAEREICTISPSHHIPLNLLPDHLAELPKQGEIILFCHHGVRSARALTWLQAHGFPSARHLEGGIDQWASEIDPEMPRY